MRFKEDLRPYGPELPSDYFLPISTANMSQPALEQSSNLNLDLSQTSHDRNEYDYDYWRQLQGLAILAGYEDGAVRLWKETVAVGEDKEASWSLVWQEKVHRETGELATRASEHSQCAAS